MAVAFASCHAFLIDVASSEYLNDAEDIPCYYSKGEVVIYRMVGLSDPLRLVSWWSPFERLRRLILL